MKSTRNKLHYEAATDIEIFEAYLHKNAGHNRTDIRRFKRALRKLATHASVWDGVR